MMKAFYFFLVSLVICALADEEYLTENVNLPCAFHVHVKYEYVPPLRDVPLRDDLEEFESYVVMNGDDEAYELQIKRIDEYDVFELYRYDLKDDLDQVPRIYNSTDSECHNDFYGIPTFFKQFKYQSKQDNVPCLFDESATCTKYERVRHTIYDSNEIDEVFLDSDKRLVGIHFYYSNSFSYQFMPDVPSLSMFQAFKKCDGSDFGLTYNCTKDDDHHNDTDPDDDHDDDDASIVKSVIVVVVAALVLALL